MAQPDSKHIFRSNLKRLAGNLDLGCDELANAIGLVGEDKKWLWRLWEEGLSRTNDKTRVHLNRLAAFLGLRAAAEFWNPSCQSNPDVLLNGNTKAWGDLVRKVADVVRAVDILWARYPDEFEPILKRYGYNLNGLIAVWVACIYGGVKCEQDEVDLFNRMVDETAAEREFQNSMHMVDRVLERAKQHPAWQEKFGEADETEIESHIQAAWAALPTTDEVFQRFIERCLQPSPKKIEPSNDGVDEIILQLQSHYNWQHHLDLRFNGDEAEADRHIRRLWGQFVRESGGTAAPGDFVSYYRGRILDNLPAPK